MRATECFAAQRILDRFIRADSVSLVLTRHTKVADEEGGWTKTPTTLTAQTFRLLDVKPQTSKRVEGTTVDLEGYLLGYSTADVTLGDQFTHSGKTYTIMTIEPGTDVRVLCGIACPDSRSGG